jgi:molybdopterin/thiamine biosynthesis adenylyltransferase
MERIEPDTEHHRTQKALKHLLGRPEADGEIIFPYGSVEIGISPEIAALPAGQLALTLTINLLARMRSIVSSVSVRVPRGLRRQSHVPLHGDDLRDGLEHLVSTIAGPGSPFPVEFDFDGDAELPVARLALGHSREGHKPSQITVEADAWTAYVNAPQIDGDWSTDTPFGPHMAACLGVAEVFKWLLHYNFPQHVNRPLHFLRDTGFSALTYAVWHGPTTRPALPSPIHLERVAIAGVGAGGSTAVYTLGCLPGLAGEITLIDPGRHKRSNLARYLLSTYEDCHQGTSKVSVAGEFLQCQQPELRVHLEDASYTDVAHRDFRLVVSTVDTPEARWDIQRDNPPVILDAAVLETIYALLRVEPGQGMCLACKHPYDPDVTWKRRAAMWGKTAAAVRELYVARVPVQLADVERLADVQGRPASDFAELLGLPFDQVPRQTECGQSHFNLQVPNQAATLPFVTAMAGVLVAAEVVKDQSAPRLALRNWFEHDLLWHPKPDRHRFRRQVPGCPLHSA